MAIHQTIGFKNISEAEDGEFALVRLADGQFYPGIKGSRDGHFFLMILSDPLPLGNDPMPGPFLSFDDERALFFGKDFVVDFNPTPDNIDIHEGGNPALGALVVIDDHPCISAHSPAGRSLVNIDTGRELQVQRCAVVKSWAIYIRRADDSLNPLHTFSID